MTDGSMEGRSRLAAIGEEVVDDRSTAGALALIKVEWVSRIRVGGGEDAWANSPRWSPGQGRLRTRRCCRAPTQARNAGRAVRRCGCEPGGRGSAPAAATQRDGHPRSAHLGVSVLLTAAFAEARKPSRPSRYWMLTATTEPLDRVTHSFIGKPKDEFGKAGQSTPMSAEEVRAPRITLGAIIEVATACGRHGVMFSKAGLAVQAGCCRVARTVDVDDNGQL
jgi:hypothetical protein